MGKARAAAKVKTAAKAKLRDPPTATKAKNMPVKNAKCWEIVAAVVGSLIVAGLSAYAICVRKTGSFCPRCRVEPPETGDTPFQKLDGGNDPDSAEANELDYLN